MLIMCAGAGAFYAICCVAIKICRIASKVEVPGLPYRISRPFGIF